MHNTFPHYLSYSKPQDNMLLHQQFFIVITKVQHVFIFSPFFLVTHHISQEKDLIKNSNLEYNME